MDLFYVHMPHIWIHICFAVSTDAAHSEDPWMEDVYADFLFTNDVAWPSPLTCCVFFFWQKLCSADAACAIRRAL